MLLLNQKVIEMTKRIMMPVEDEAGLDAQLAHHFGRAPYFAIVEFDENQKTSKVKTEPNRSEHMGGAPGHSHESFLALKPDIVVACTMGPGALSTFQNAGITVLKAIENTVKGNIESFKEGKLKEMVGGCEHAHHHEHEH
jgi:predicted Fe-Mo cluster-binding NifX family protein